MADILTSIGIDDRAARSALKDYQRFANDRAKDIDKGFTTAGELARKFVGFQVVKRELSAVVSAVQDYAKTSIDAAANLDRMEAAAQKFKVAIGRDVYGAFEGVIGRAGSLLDTLNEYRTTVVNLFGDIGGLIFGNTNKTSGHSQEIDDLRAQLDAQAARSAEIRKANEDIRKVILEQDALSTNARDREISQENEKHRLAERSIREKYKELDIADDLLEREGMRHHMAVQRIEAEDRDRTAKAAMERDALSRGGAIASARAAASLAGVRGDPAEQLRNERGALYLQFQKDRAAVLGDPAIKTLEREARLSALQDEYQVSDKSLTDEFSARQAQETRDQERAVELERMQVDIQALRLRGLDNEADVREVILGYEERLEEVRKNRLLDGSTRSSLESSITATRDRYLGALVGRQARDAALEEYQGARAIVSYGGGFGRSGADVNRIAIGGSGSSRRPLEEEARKQTVTQDQIKDIISQIASRLATLPGLAWQ